MTTPFKTKKNRADNYAQNLIKDKLETQQYSVDFNLSDQDHCALVSLVCDSLESHQTYEQTQNSLDELKQLLQTLNIPYLEQTYIQKKTKLDPATLLGYGKLLEICEDMKAKKAKNIVFDLQLSASQMRNIEKLTGFKVVDRCQIIFQIFAQNARTREAKIQIEMSRLQYMLPRLTSLWTHFTKQKGGIGLKGEGEQQLELDRRIIKRKIANYSKQLEEFRISKIEQSKKRQQSSLVTALVGHTNVGKSSLMNRLCHVQLLAENKLFATLDATFRLLTPDSRPPVVLVDTVGFISNLPTALVEGFKTTFLSAAEADLLLIVVDASSPCIEHQITLTEKTLAEMNFSHKPKLFLFNKKDLLTPQQILSIKLIMRKYEHAMLISSYDTNDIASVRETVLHHFLNQQSHYDLFIPYEEGSLHAKLKKMTNILTTAAMEKGIFYRVKTPATLFDQLGVKNFTLSPEESIEMQEKSLLLQK